MSRTGWTKVESPWPMDAVYVPDWCGPSKSKTAALERARFWASVSTSTERRTIRMGGKPVLVADGHWRWDAPSPSSAAARTAWQLIRGPLDPDTTLERTCDGPRACIRPSHYQPGEF